ncbi:MAG: hypothetical protein EFT35_04715 [Methanophagales archaeon ANME-1-THS]|nr:MAG: hypothetical protein EFT35_04715 [Methanophagales archaeon ANME-1-THS]
MEQSIKRAVLLVLFVVVVLTAVSLIVVLKEEPKTIRFGCALSLSGAREQEGKLTREGYELWKEHVNSQGGILIGNDQYLVEILYYDDESDPQKTASLVEKLIVEDNVDLLLGPYGSDCTFEAAAIAERYRVPMVEGGGASETIFAQGFRYTFGVISLAGDYFKTLLEGAARLEPEPKKVAIISAGDLFSVWCGYRCATACRAVGI